MDITFLQTSDITYRPLLELSSQTVREYCTRHQCGYESYFGILRGYHPWHATFNRIPLLKRMLDAGYSGWVCYLDADAYIADLDFDLKSYVSDKADIAFVVAPAKPAHWWDVNAGVFLINFAHPVAHEIVHGWFRHFNAISDARLQAAKSWGQVPDDQVMLHQVLKSIPGAEAATSLQHSPNRLLNYRDGIFIRQVLRAYGGFEGRVAHLKAEVQRVLKDTNDHTAVSPEIPAGQTPEAFIRALYRVLLLREPDPTGLAHGLRKMRAGISLEDEMRSCLQSQEFAVKHGQFIKTFVQAKPETRVKTANMP